MREFNPGDAEGNFGFDEYRRVRRVPGKPEPQSRIGEFFLVIEQPDGNAECGKSSCPKTTLVSSEFYTGSQSRISRDSNMNLLNLKCGGCCP